jgi:hypothetical protein
VEKQRTPRTSTKAIQCPFEIHYSFLSIVKSKDDPSWRPDLFYQAKITFAEYNHLCSMTPQSHHLALIHSGRTQPSLEGMNDIISLMGEKPHVEHTTLRAMLMKDVPDFKSLDGTFLCNFRRRAMKYVYDPNTELTTADARRLLRAGPVASAEELDIDNPIIQMNFRDVLRKIIQESSQTWSFHHEEFA